jgi:hypothetical protein
MQTVLLWVFALYGFASAWVHIQKSMHTPRYSRALHCYILTDHSQAQIEWVLRSIHRLGQLEGKEFKIFLIDSGSNDDTLRIVERFIRNGVHIQLIQDTPEAIAGKPEAEQFVVDLRKGDYACVLRTT